jgi:hypothetical protein
MRQLSTAAREAMEDYGACSSNANTTQNFRFESEAVPPHKSQIETEFVLKVVAWL